MRWAQGRFLKFISFVNWLVLTLAVLASLAGAVIFLLTWPFPQVSHEGQRFVDVLIGTELSVVVAAFAGLATWLADKRHPAFWIAEIALAVAVAAAFYYGLSQS